MEMEEFETDTKLNSLLGIELCLPIVRGHIPNKDTLQTAVNRLQHVTVCLHKYCYLFTHRLTELINWSTFTFTGLSPPTDSLDHKRISNNLLANPLTPLHHMYLGWRCYIYISKARLLFIRLSVCLSIYLSIGLSVCLSVRPSGCPSVCLSVCLSVWLSVCLAVCLFVHQEMCIQDRGK